MRGRRQDLRSEEGFTLVELMVAVVLATVGVMAVMSVLEHSRALSNTTEKNEVASHIAERELERASALPFDQLALVALPAHASDPNDPDYRVTGTAYQYDYNADAATESLVTGANAGVSTANTWNDPDSRLSGGIHRYVTLVGGNQNVRRVTVVVTVNGAGLTKPVVISSLVVNPKPSGP